MQLRRHGPVRLNVHLVSRVARQDNIRYTRITEEATLKTVSLYGSAATHLSRTQERESATLSLTLSPSVRATRVAQAPTWSRPAVTLMVAI